MSYDSNIPQTNDLRPPDFEQIQENFSVFSEVFQAEHGALEEVTVADRGKHDVVRLPPLAVDPSTGAQEGALYTFRNALDHLELRFRQESDGSILILTKRGFPSVGGLVSLATARFTDTPALLSSTNVASISKSVSGSDVTFELTFSSELPFDNYWAEIYPIGSTVSITTPFEAVVDNAGVSFKSNTATTTITDFSLMVWGLHV